MKRLAILVVLALFVISCGGGGSDGPSAPSNVFQGTFVLQSVSATDRGTTVTFTPPAVNGSFIFAPDGNFTGNMSWPAAGINEPNLAGTYTVNGNLVIMTYNDGSMETLTLSPDQNQLSFTMVDGSTTASVVFVRA